MRSRIAFVLATLALLTALPSFASYRTSVWIPTWDANALPSIQLNAGKLDESNPCWYQIAADGTFTKEWNAENPSLRAAMTGTQILPTIQNYLNGGFDDSVVIKIASNPALRETHANALTQLVVQNAFDGIDIDYESLPSTARNDFTALMQTLATKLHAAGKKLSVTVSAKTSDSETWEGPGAQDWPALGAIADTIKIMAYDYHWNGGTAGAIAPLAWLDQVATYAESTLPRGKAIMGLPWYGYDWKGRNATNVTAAGGVALAQSVGATITHDINGEATFTYADHVVFFQDASSYQKKVDLITSKHPGIGGFAHWRAGTEDAAFWATLAAARSGGSSTTNPATPAPQADFTINGPLHVNLNAGDATSVQFSLVSLNGFSSNVTLTATPLDNLGGTVAFSVPTLGSGAPAVLQVITSAQTAVGDHAVRITAKSGSISHDTTVTIHVAAAPVVAPVKPVTSRHRASKK
jgi:spore germination protein